MKTLLIFSVLCTLLFSTSCSYESIEEASLPSTEDEGDGVTPLPDDLDTKTLFLVLGIRWEGSGPSGEYTNILKCSTPDMPALGANYHCNVSIPEAQLYYGDLHFRIGSAEQCPVIFFQPYYYMRSASASFAAPGGEEPLICDEAPIPAECYGGMAPRVVPSFPKNNSLYIIRGISQYLDVAVPSEGVTRWYGGARVNYHVTNDISPASRLTTGTNNVNARVANSVVDYRVICQNIWGETINSLTLTISDENEDGDVDGVSDQFTDWD